MRTNIQQKFALNKSPVSVRQVFLGMCSTDASTGNVRIPNSVSQSSIKDNAFRSAVGIREITMPDSVTKIGSAAFQLSSVRHVLLSNRITVLEPSLFLGCRYLQQISIPDSVVTIGFQAFQVCGSLSRVEIPDSVSTIAKVAFSQCTSLSSVGCCQVHHALNCD